MVGKDREAIINTHRTQAPTTFKFFIAGESKNAGSDYHDNFTCDKTVKIYATLGYSWGPFCLHQQLCGKLIDDDGIPWFNFITNTASRRMIVEDDNAPFNGGVMLALKDATKKECARILRLLGQTNWQITHHYKDKITPPMQLNVETPVDDEL